MPDAVSPYRNPLWPDAVWDVSGAFVNDRELIAFHDFCRLCLGFQPFSVVHGSPLFKWNCGRVLKHLIREVEEIRVAGLAYEARGVAVDLTFSNFALGPEDMKDVTGNTLMEFFRRHNPTGKNAVIMASDALYEHVKRNFPELRTVSSILKVTMEKGRGKRDYYLRLADKYDKVMIHPDDVTRWDLLESLEDKSKYELIVNEYCMKNCPIRHLHYTSLSETAADFFGYDSSAFDAKLAGNGCSNLNALLTSDRFGVVAMAQEEMRRAYEMGFRQFKLQGRGYATAAPLLFDLLRLVLREDAADENAMHALKMRFWEMLLPDAG